MFLFLLVLLIVAAWFIRQFGKLFYCRNYLWKDWTSPPLDNFTNGHKPSLRRAQANNTFNDLMCGWVKDYGDTILIWRDFKPVIFTTDPEVLEDLWTNITSFSKLHALPNRQLYDKPLTGIRSFLTIKGGLTWAVKRKMLSGFFTKANQKVLFPKIQHLVNKSVGDLKQLYGDTQIYDMELGFATMAENLLIICGLDNLSDMFTTKPGYLAKNVLNLLEVLPMASNNVLGKKFKLTPEVQHGMTFITNVRNELQRAYHEVLQRTAAQGESHSQDSQASILWHLVNINKFGYNGEDCDNFINDIMTLILVADNISKVVSILFAKALREPGIYQKMEKEAMETEIKSYEDLSKLHYIELVILELMRWSPVLQRGARGIMKGDPTYKAGKIIIGGKKVPYTGTCDIQWSQYVMHHNTKYWNSPDKFDPERFANGTSGFVRNTYIPFIGGPRACLGKHLAMAKMKILIHSMLKNFHMSIIPGEEDLVLDRKYTIVKVRQGKNVLLKAK